MRLPVAILFLGLFSLPTFAWRVTPVHAQACRIDMNAAPLVGTAPLRVQVGGTAWGFVFTLGVDMGGEVSLIEDLNADPLAMECRIGWSYEVGHEFNCPGTYEIAVYDFDHPAERGTATITVSPPPLPYLFAFEDDSAYRPYIAMHAYDMDRPFDSMVVDWGDGNVQSFTWERRGLYMGTPTHQYAIDGVYAVKVMYTYDGTFCDWTQTVPLTVTIPLPATPTKSSTWGSVKALYLRR